MDILSEFKQKLESLLNVDIDALFKELDKIKGKPLTNTEKIYLCLGLCNYSNYKIAFITSKYRMPTVEEEIAEQDPVIKRRANNVRTSVFDAKAYLKDFLGVTRLPSSPLDISEVLQNKGIQKLSESPDIQNAREQFLLRIRGSVKPEEIIKTLKDRHNINISLIEVYQSVISSEGDFNDD